MTKRLFERPTSQKLLREGPPKYKLIDRNGCGGIAFYFFEKPRFGQGIKASDVLLPNGKHPREESRIRCYQCGGPVYLTNAYLEKNE